MILSASILSADFSKLGTDILESAAAGTDYIHVDVMDGVFVPSISFGMPVIRSIRKVTDITFDVHLMIEEPIRYIDEFAEDGADIITVHYEACRNLKATIDAVHGAGCRCGVAVSPATDISVLYPYLDTIEMALVMTVEPGFGGQKYLDCTTPKIRAIRNRIDTLKLPVGVETDGGVTRDNVRDILEAGADIIVAGSAVYKGDIASNVRYFKEI